MGQRRAHRNGMTPLATPCERRVPQRSEDTRRLAGGADTLDSGWLRVERSVSVVGARQMIKKPKTAAGVRTIALPMWLLPDLEQLFPAGIGPSRTLATRWWRR
jgi:hypothetical protein